MSIDSEAGDSGRRSSGRGSSLFTGEVVISARGVRRMESSVSNLAKTRIRVPVIVVAAIGLALIATSAALAAGVLKNGGTVTAVRTVTASDAVSTTSSGVFVDIPGISTTVKVPDGQHALLIITFSAQSSCQDFSVSKTAYCFVRAVVDGGVPLPGATIFDSAAEDAGIIITSWETNSMQFVSGPIGPGTHTVKVQYEVDEPDAAFALTDRTLTVLRSKV